MVYYISEAVGQQGSVGPDGVHAAAVRADAARQLPARQDQRLPPGRALRTGAGAALADHDDDPLPHVRTFITHADEAATCSGNATVEVPVVDSSYIHMVSRVLKFESMYHGVPPDAVAGTRAAV